MTNRTCLRNILIPMISFLMVSCTPDKMEISLYTSDVDAVINGETINVPVKMSFSMIGEDKENNLEKAKNVAKNYLPPDSKFSISKESYKKFFIVETTLPFVKKGLKLGKRNLGGFVYDPTTAEITFLQNTPLIKELNSLLKDINMMLSLSLPPKNYKLRIISDTKKQLTIHSYAVWVSKQPFLFHSAALKRRDEIELVFKGGSDSVYSQIPIFVEIEMGK
jgi:hypothetical protein